MKRFLLLALFVFTLAMAVQAQGTAFRITDGLLANRPANCFRTGAVDVYFGTDTQLLYFCKVAGSPGTWSTGVPIDIGAAGANTALSNLAAVSINTSLLAQTGVDAGSTTKPFRDIYIFGSGTYATTYLRLTGTPTSTRVWTIPDATDTFVGLAVSQALTGKTYNGLTVTTTTGTFTLANGKTFVVSNGLTLAGTDSTTQTFPTTSATIARTDTGQTFSGANTLTGGSGDTTLTVTGTQPAGVSSGNGTTGSQALTLTAPAGGDTSSATANARGGNGGGATVTGGAGGQQTGASSGTARGGTGGNLAYTGGAGGAATAVTGTVPGGGGGATNFTGGVGGTSATSTGGAGGAGAMLGGVGGVTTAAAVSGVGGGYSITGGAGGANSNAAGTSGAGGNVVIDAGAAGTASGGATTGNNGQISLGATNSLSVTIGNTTASTQTNIKSPKTTLGNAAYFSCVALTTNGSGDIGCTASDAKIKRDIKPFFGGLVAIRNIQPETFRYLDSTNYADGGQLHLGFVAQNLQKANPLFASRMGSGLLQPEGLAIQAATVSAVKELDAKITALTALVEAQQKEINRLRHHRR